MNTLQFSTHINAPKEKVWEVLWNDTTFRDWANLVDEGTYIKGELQEGNQVEFISSVNGYGVTSLVEQFRENELASFKHSADTQQTGAQERDKEWTGGTESYSLTERGGVTSLTIKTDVPKEQEETFKDRLPKALERIKILAEKR